MRFDLPSALLVLLTISTAASAQTRFDVVHPIFRGNCTPCHSTSGSGGFNIAANNVNSAYTQSQLSSYYVPGQTKGFAALVRVQDGSMPQNAGCTGDPTLDAGNTGCLTAGEQALIQSWITDGQLPPLATTGSIFCYGDGTAAACPCGNNGASGGGCASSVDPNGGRLIATGTASVSNDSLVLRGSRMPDASALYFQGTQSLAGGSGAPFGDGLRCVGGTVTRLGTKQNAAGASQFPAVGDASVSVVGALPPSGGSRHYQVWYRNSAAFCTADTFNLTNGLSVTWAP